MKKTNGALSSCCKVLLMSLAVGQHLLQGHMVLMYRRCSRGYESLSYANSWPQW